MFNDGRFHLLEKQLTTSSSSSSSFPTTDDVNEIFALWEGGGKYGWNEEVCGAGTKTCAENETCLHAFAFTLSSTGDENRRPVPVRIQPHALKRALSLPTDFLITGHTMCEANKTLHNTSGVTADGC